MNTLPDTTQKTADKYSLVSLLVETLKEIYVTFSVDGELFTPPNTDQEGEE